MRQIVKAPLLNPLKESARSRIAFQLFRVAIAGAASRRLSLTTFLLPFLDPLIGKKVLLAADNNPIVAVIIISLWLIFFNLLLGYEVLKYVSRSDDYCTFALLTLYYKMLLCEGLHWPCDDHWVPYRVDQSARLLLAQRRWLVARMLLVLVLVSDWLLVVDGVVFFELLAVII